MPSGSASDTRRVRFTGTENNSPSVYETRTRSGNPAKENQVKTTKWIGGQGHSGCRFSGMPSYVNNGPIAGGRIGFAASFKEVGTWIRG